MNAACHRNLLKALGCLAAMTIAIAADAAPDRFARLVANPSAVYAGQTFSLTLSIYSTAYPLDKAVSISGMPPIDTLTVGAFQELALQQDTIEGRTYEIRRFQTRAKAPAARAIPFTLAIQGSVLQETRSYFFVQRILHPVLIPLEPYTLTVLPLPDKGRPASFSGAVGEFSFKVSAAPLNVAVGDLINLDIQIEGLGLPDGVLPAAVPGLNGLKAYEMLRLPADSSETLRRFRQTVVPLNPAIREIPPVSFAFFNTRTGRYETRTAGPFPLVFHEERTVVYPVYAPTQAVAPAVPDPQGHPRDKPSTGLWSRVRTLLSVHPVDILYIPVDTVVRLAPAEEAMALFTLKQGDKVQLELRREGWLRIQCPSGIGWIREDFANR